MTKKEKQQAYLVSQGYRKIVDLWENNLENGWSRDAGLVDAFDWDYSPEGADFWNDVDEYFNGHDSELLHPYRTRSLRWV